MTERKAEVLVADQTKGSRSTEAVIQLDMAGRYTAANPAALDLLGVSLAELRAAPPDRFTIRQTRETEQAAFRAEWEAGGSRPLVGTAGLKRADGSTIRVTYAIQRTRSGFTARLWRVDGAPEAPPSVYTVGDVLRQWRAAEMRLADLIAGTADWARTLSEIELLRDRYQELFRSVRPQA
jgi:PAS domain S-box-containing protein